MPGSGKSTLADKLGVKNVGRDVLREQLFSGAGKLLESWQEDLVTQEQEHVIAKFAASGDDLIVDETNLRDKYMKRHFYLAGLHMLDPVIIDFRHVPPEICIERDSWRDADRQVGEEVIWKLFTKYVKGQV